MRISARDKTIVSTLALLQLFLMAGAIQLKGVTIQELLGGKAEIPALIRLAVGFSALHFLSIVASVFGTSLRAILGASFFASLWEKSVPLRVRRKHVTASDRFYYSASKLAPRLFELRLQMATTIATSVAVLALALGKAWIDRFWWGLLLIPFLTLLSFLSTRFYAAQFGTAVQDFNEQSSSLIGWLRSYFTGNKEIYFSWRLAERPELAHDWFRRRGAQLTGSWRRLNATILKRDLVSSLFVELPYLVTVAAILVVTGAGHLEVKDAFVWIGIAEFVLMANAGLKQFRTMRIEAASLEESLRRDLTAVSEPGERDAGGREAGNSMPATPPPAFFVLSDGSEAHVSTAPGLHTVRGANGSGKSTLVESLYGHNTDFSRWSASAISAYRAHFGDDVRLIERDPVVFGDLSGLTQQIFGPASGLADEQALAAIDANFPEALSPEVRAFWLAKLRSLYAVWAERGNQQLSSGERVALSVARLLAGWDGRVRAVFSDECDAFLDAETREHFMRTLRELAADLPVFLISHLDQAAPVATAEVSLLACDDQGAHAFAIPLRLTAREGFAPATASGNVAQAMLPELERTLAALVRADSSLEKLGSLSFHLEGSFAGFQVGQTASAGLALALGLVKIADAIERRPTTAARSASGHVLLDGTVLPVRAIEAKVGAARAQGLAVLTPAEVPHLSRLRAAAATA